MKMVKNKNEATRNKMKRNETLYVERGNKKPRAATIFAPFFNAIYDFQLILFDLMQRCWCWCLHYKEIAYAELATRG